MSLASHGVLKAAPSCSTLYFANFVHRYPHHGYPQFSVPLPCRYIPGSLHFDILNHKLQRPLNLSSLSIRRFRIRAFETEALAQRDRGTGDFDLDSFLSVAELVCLVSSVVISVGFAVNYAVASWKRTVLVVFGDRVLAWGTVLMVIGVALGAWIRRRQWRRLCRETANGSLEVNLIERIEKLEEDLRSSATIVRVLSRQLEKLGIRFRATRKALKEPIAETAALAKKNSEATRALAIQEDILEKELGEIQKVLLAMQEQQQKQLELILAIGKTGKMFEGRQNELTREQIVIERNDPTGEGLKPKKEVRQI